MSKNSQSLRGSPMGNLQLCYYGFPRIPWLRSVYTRLLSKSGHSEIASKQYSITEGIVQQNM